MADTTNYALDPTGGMTSTGAPGYAEVTGGAGTATLGGLAPQSNDPYSIFNSNLISMLTATQNENTQNNKLLGGAKDQLTNLSVAPNGPQPFNPQASSASQVGAQETLQNSFNPAITSISTQEANTAAALQGVSSTINSIQGALFKTLSPGQSLVAPDGTVVTQGHSWTYAFNPTADGGKGAYENYDTITGTWSTDPANKVTAVPPTKAGVVAGIDISGASTGMPPYATDPQKAEKDNTLYNELVTSLPAGVPTPDGINKFIGTIAAGKSPITGAMIMMAAKNWGIDPNYLAANIGEETQFGTTGTDTISKFNPGGLKDMSGQYATFKNWVAGVDATAKKLAQYMPGNPNAPTQNSATPTGTDPRGLQISPAYQKRVAQLSPVLQKYVTAGPGGIAYLDGDAITATSSGTTGGSVSVDLLNMAAQQAASAGLPVGDATTKSQMDNVNTLAQQQEAMHQLISGILTNGSVSWEGHIYNSLATLLNAKLQTDPNRTLLDSYVSSVTGAAQNIKSLAGGQGTGVRITGFEIGAVQDTFPQSGDSSQQAQAKLKALDYKLASALATAFPDYNPGTIENPNPVQPQSSTTTSLGGPQEGAVRSYGGVNYKVVNGTWTPQ